MIIAALDFETSGFITKNKPINDRHNGHGIQVGLVIFDSQAQKIHHQISTLLKFNCHMSSGAENVHHISAVEMDKFGVNPDIATALVVDTLSKADLIVGHGLHFDIAHLEANIKRCSVLDAGFKKEFKTVDTMFSMVNVCKIPTAKTAFKRPTLAEAYKRCFDVGFESEHNGLADATATLNIYRWLSIQQPENIIVKQTTISA